MNTPDTNTTDSAVDRPEKMNRLRAALQRMERVLVAFSGGVDSTFLMAVAHDVLGNNAEAVTVSSVFFPSWEMADAQTLSAEHGWPHRILEIDPLSIASVSANPPDRCYHCKQAIFSALQRLANENGTRHVLDGATQSDEGDYRPGTRATAELGILSPLKNAGFVKSDVRALSRDMNLTTWNKPAYACLASRIPYGTPITADALARVDRAECFLHDLGYADCRVRAHGEVARIELPPHAIQSFVAHHRTVTEQRLQEAGFRYVTLDLQGYRMGSLNEALPDTIPAPEEPNA